jgi:hypothetical protein
MNKKLLIGVIAVAVVASLVAIGVSRNSDNQEPEKTAQISDLNRFTRGDVSYNVGDGYLSGSILNPTNEVRDYEIAIQRWSPQFGWGSDSPSVFQETVAKISVLQVQPGEQRSWECSLFKHGAVNGLYWEWRVCVDGWCWIMPAHFD